MDEAIQRLFLTDFKHILDHPSLTTEMKAGYLLAIRLDVRGAGRMSIADAATEVSRFVREYSRNNQ